MNCSILKLKRTSALFMALCLVCSSVPSGAWAVCPSSGCPVKQEQDANINGQLDIARDASLPLKLQMEKVLKLADANSSDPFGGKFSIKKFPGLDEQNNLSWKKIEDLPLAQQASYCRPKFEPSALKLGISDWPKIKFKDNPKDIVDQWNEVKKTARTTPEIYEKDKNHPCKEGPNYREFNAEQARIYSAEAAVISLFNVVFIDDNPPRNQLGKSLRNPFDLGTASMSDSDKIKQLLDKIGSKDHDIEKSEQPKTLISLVSSLATVTEEPKQITFKPTNETGDPTQITVSGKEIIENFEFVQNGIRKLITRWTPPSGDKVTIKITSAQATELVKSLEGYYNYAKNLKELAVSIQTLAQKFKNGTNLKDQLLRPYNEMSSKAEEIEKWASGLIGKIDEVNPESNPPLLNKSEMQMALELAAGIANKFNVDSTANPANLANPANPANPENPDPNNPNANRKTCANGNCDGNSKKYSTETPPRETGEEVGRRARAEAEARQRESDLRDENRQMKRDLREAQAAGGGGGSGGSGMMDMMIPLMMAGQMGGFMNAIKPKSDDSSKDEEKPQEDWMAMFMQMQESRERRRLDEEAAKQAQRQVDAEYALQCVQMGGQFDDFVKVCKPLPKEDRPVNCEPESIFYMRHSQAMCPAGYRYTSYPQYGAGAGYPNYAQQPPWSNGFAPGEPAPGTGMPPSGMVMYPGYVCYDRTQPYMQFGGCELIPQSTQAEQPPANTTTVTVANNITRDPAAVQSGQGGGSLPGNPNVNLGSGTGSNTPVYDNTISGCAKCGQQGVTWPSADCPQACNIAPGASPTLPGGTGNQNPNVPGTPGTTCAFQGTPLCDLAGKPPPGCTTCLGNQSGNAPSVPGGQGSNNAPISETIISK